MAAKQVILFIVEGMSDMRSLELILTRYFSNSHVKVEVTHGDITSDINTNASNISAKISTIAIDFCCMNAVSSPGKSTKGEEKSCNCGILTMRTGSAKGDDKMKINLTGSPENKMPRINRG